MTDSTEGIFCLCHRKVDYVPDNTLQCGTDLYGRIEDFKYADNTGDNISNLNEFFCELTGIYWIWKNVHTPVKGQFQYRRQIEYNEGDLDDCEIIAARPLPLIVSVRKQYEMCHNVKDLDYAGIIVKRLYPDYAADWERFIVNGRVLFYSNGFVMKEKDYDAYCDWLFSILSAWLKGKNLNPLDIEDYVKRNLSRYKSTVDTRYQSEIGGFLSERLFTLYILHNFEKIKVNPYKKFEGILI